MRTYLEEGKRITPGPARGTRGRRRDPLTDEKGYLPTYLYVVAH